MQELLHYFPPIVAGVLIPFLVVVALIVIPYFNVNVQGESLWAAGGKRRLPIFLSWSFLPFYVFFASFEAWTVFIPTVLFAGLAIAGYFFPSRTRGVAGFSQVTRAFLVAHDVVYRHGNHSDGDRNFFPRPWLVLGVALEIVWPLRK